MSDPRDHDLGTKLKTLDEKDLGKSYEHGFNFKDKVVPTYTRLSQIQYEMDFDKFIIYCKLLAIPLVFLLISSYSLQYASLTIYYTAYPYTKIFTSVFKYLLGFRTGVIRPKQTTLYQTFKNAISLTSHKMQNQLKKHIYYWLSRYPFFMGLTYLGHQILQTEEVVPTIMFSSFGYLIFFGRNSLSRVLRYPVGAFITGFSGILFTELAYGMHSNWTVFNPAYIKWPESISNKIIESRNTSFKERFEEAKDDIADKAKSFKEKATRNFKEKFNRSYITKSLIEAKENAIDFYYGLFGNKFIEAPIEVASTLREMEMMKKSNEDYKSDEFTFTDNVGNRDYHQPRVTQSIVAAISGIRAAGRAIINPQVPESISNTISKINEFRLNDPRIQKKDISQAKSESEEEINIIIKGTSYLLNDYKEEAKSKSFNFSSLSDGIKSFLKRKDE